MCHCGNIQSFKFPDHLHTLCSFSSAACPSTVNWAYKARVPAGHLTCHLLSGQRQERHTHSSAPLDGTGLCWGSMRELKCKGKFEKLIYTCKHFRRRAGTALFSTENSWVLTATRHQEHEYAPEISCAF